ncbi:group II intron maturase-specific domain-containing protein [Streptosporangium canum]
MSVDAVVQDLNDFLRGWATYVKYGHSTIRISRIRYYATHRPTIFIGKRHKTRTALRHRRGRLPLAGPVRPDQAVWNRRPARSRQALAGKAAYRR